jgi:hypothetical protein
MLCHSVSSASGRGHDRGVARAGILVGAKMKPTDRLIIVYRLSNRSSSAQGLAWVLFYRLPQAEYDRLLPLTVTPRPEKLTRVLLWAVGIPAGSPPSLRAARTSRQTSRAGIQDRS